MNLPDDTFKHLWFPFTCSNDMVDYPPRVIRRGDGVYLFDEDGRRYLDAIGSWWVSVLGHCHPRINAAVKRQIDDLEHVMMAGFISRPALELSHRLAEMLPSELSRIFYSDDGSTAVEVAMKISLQYGASRSPGKRTSFVSLKGGYHGDTLGAMSVGDIPAYHALFHTAFKSQFYADGPYCYRCPAGKEKETCSAECMESLERILSEKADTIAACIFEPMVQAAGGMRVYPAKVLTRIRDACRQHGVLSIADEVAVGFGRTGRLFACEHAAFVPDIMCCAKGLTGGYLPMAVTAVRGEIYERFCGDFMAGKELSHGHSFTGNPLAASAACETLAIIKEENIPESLKEKTGFFQAKLKEFCDIDVVGDVRSIGMIGAIELVSDKTTKKPFEPKKRVLFHIARKALDKGVIIRPLGNVLYFVPAFIITEEQISEMMEVTKESIRETV